LSLYRIQQVTNLRDVSKSLVNLSKALEDLRAMYGIEDGTKF